MGSVPWVLICTVLFVCIHPETSASDPIDINVEFKQSTYYINENDKAVSLTVVLSEQLNSTNVTVYINDGSTDTDNITIPAKQISSTESVSTSATKDNPPSFTITKLCLNATNDADKKCSDTESVTGPDGPKATIVTVTVGEVKQAIVEFNAELKFSDNKYSFKENSGSATIVLILSKPVLSDFNLTITSTALTSDKKYEHGPFHVTFPANQTSVSFDISLSDDNEVGEDERFSLDIRDPNLPDGVKLLNPSCEVTIVDTTIVVNFNQSQYRFKEDEKLAQLELTINKELNVAFNVSVKIIPASATDDDFNCTSHTVVVNFPINATSATFDIPLIDDTDYEDNESFNVEIDPSFDLPPGVIVGVTNEATVTIVNDDVYAELKFSEKEYSFKENSGSATIELFLTKPVLSDFNLSITSAALTSDKKYQHGPFHVTFPANETSVSFNISLIDDNEVGEDEKFSLEIHDPNLPDGVELLNPLREVTIVDSTIAVNFDQSLYRFKEDKKLAQLVLTINEQLNVAFDVSVKITPASATDYDFNCTSHTVAVNFPINATSATFDITLIDDTDHEDNESFTVTIDPSSKLPPDVSIGVTNEATVTIVDDDVKCQKPTTDSGNFTCSLGDDGVHSYKDTCSITCNTGYTLTGSDTRVCQSDGSWSDMDSVCERVKCQKPTTDNGNFICSLGDDGVHSYKETCNITCDTGYTLTGSDTRVCQSDGRWSDMDSVCERVKCPNITELDNGNIDCSLGDDGVYSYEDTCNITCDSGYELTGTDTRKCRIDGSWSDMDSVCEKAPPPSDAATSSSETPNAGATTTLTTGATTTLTTGATTTLTTGATTTLTTDAPTTDATTAPTTATGSSSSFRNYFYISIFLLLILVPAAYVYYQNREKINKYFKGNRFNRRRNVRYQLLPTSVGEALGNSHKAN